MNLLTSHAGEIFHNALDVIQDDKGRTFPRRFTEKQFDHYTCNEGWVLRSLCTTGIKIVFRTDSPTLELDMDIEQGCRGFYSLDLQINGHYHPGFLSLRHPDGSMKLKFDLCNDGKEVEVAIGLSHFRPTYFKSIRIADGSSFAPVAQPEKKILCMGDSITQGMTAMQPANTYVGVLARLLGYRLLNQGVGGHIAEAASFDTELPYKPDVITIAYGTNDWSRQFTHEEQAQHVEDYMKTVRKFAPDTPVFWITPLWRNNMYEQKPNGNLLEFSKPIAEAAEKNGAIVLDGMDMMPHDGDYFADGLHPNDIGGNVYGANVFAQIIKHLC